VARGRAGRVIAPSGVTGGARGEPVHEPPGLFAMRHRRTVMDSVRTELGADFARARDQVAEARLRKLQKDTRTSAPPSQTASLG
jgi:hypothetical protein